MDVHEEYLKRVEKSDMDNFKQEIREFIVGIKADFREFKKDIRWMFGIQTTIFILLISVLKFVL